MNTKTIEVWSEVEITEIMSIHDFLWAMASFNEKKSVETPYPYRITIEGPIAPLSPTEPKAGTTGEAAKYYANSYNIWKWENGKMLYHPLGLTQWADSVYRAPEKLLKSDKTIIEIPASVAAAMMKGGEKHE